MTSGPSLALRQALIAASGGASARAAAVSALRDTTVWAATWPTDPATLRTLTNSDGVTALAVFSDQQELEQAAIRYAWLGVDGRVPSKHLHVSEVVRFAKQHRAQLVVVDIAADHALELDEGEMEQVAGAAPSTNEQPAQRPAAVASSRPPTASARSVMPPPSSAISTRPHSPSARPSARPPSQDKLAAFPSTRPPALSALKPSSVIPENPKQRAGVSATFGSPNVSSPSASPNVGSPSASAGVATPSAGMPTVATPSADMPTVATPSAGMPTVATLNVVGLLGFGAGPSDALIDAFSQVLRDYPEVEWACAVRQLRSGTADQPPTVGLRVDPGFRKNLNEISTKLRDASIAHGEAFEVLPLDQPEQIKLARRLGRPFYPWRKK